MSSSQFYEKNFSDLCLLETLQMFDVPTIQSSGLASLRKGGEDHDPHDRDFCSYDEALIAENPVWEYFVTSMNRFDSVAMASFTGDIIRNYAAIVEN